MCERERVCEEREIEGESAQRGGGTERVRDLFRAVALELARRRDAQLEHLVKRKVDIRLP